MLSLRKNVLLGLLIATCTLAGCGYHTVYGTHSGSETNSSLSNQLNAISIQPIANKEGIILRNALLDRMNASGKPEHPLYKMYVTLTSTTDKLGVKESDTATRANLKMVAKILLTDAQTGETVWKDQQTSFVSYNILESTYATVAAEKDASKRGLTELADKITLSTGLKLQHQNK